MTQDVGSVCGNRISMLYVIQGALGFVKIGFSKRAHGIKHRLKTLQTGNPHPLRVLAHGEGSKHDERQVHHFFVDERMTGEWFRETPRVIRFIELLPSRGARAALRAIEAADA